MKNIKNKIWAFKQKALINLFDKSAPIDGIIKTNGFCKIENYFDTSDLDPIIESLNKEQNRKGKEVYDIKIDNPLLISDKICKIFFDKKLNKIVTDYLGKGVRFDFCNAWRLRHNKISTYSNSNHWHHDCVGHRLKVFVLLSDTYHSKGQKTFYISESNKNKYSTYNTFIDDEKRVPESLINLSKISELDGKKGDLFIFDTNGLHKGNYENEIDDRDIVQLEFSNSLKGKFLSGYIGPRDTYLPIKDYQNTLVDTRKLKLAGNFFKYG